MKDGSVELESNTASDDLSGEAHILEPGVVNSGQGTRARALLGLVEGLVTALRLAKNGTLK